MFHRRRPARRRKAAGRKKPTEVKLKVKLRKMTVKNKAGRKLLRIAYVVCALSTFNSQLSTLYAQRVTLARADVPRIPTDTLPTDRSEVRLVTFSDGTFRLIPTNPFHFRNTPAYSANWDTINLFAYRNIELRDLPERTTLDFAEAHGFRAPATGTILSKYGPRSGRAHNGTDIRVTHGQPIYAAFDGIVRLSRWNSGGFGNIVVIRHPNGLETYYGHLSRRAVAADEWVSAGQVIGYGGRTGRATTNHLHFETRYADQSFDAERIFDFDKGELRRRTFALRREYFSIRSRAVEGIESEDDVSGDLSDNLLAVVPAAAADGQNAQESAPAVRPAASEPIYHKIQSGDTLLALALRYDTTVASLCSLNGISRTTTLRIGRSLRIK